MAQTKFRSPNYPRLAFDGALEKVRIIYGKQHKHAASRDVIAQALGYKNFNTGTAKAVIASLKYYRLLEPAGEGFRVSADAIRVLELPKEDPERIQALLRILFAPSVFAELRRNYRDELPLSVRHNLVTREFSPKAADEIIRLYRSNFDFLRTQGVDGQTDEEADRTEDVAGHVRAQAPSGESRPSGTSLKDPFDRVLQFQIAENTDVRVHFRGRPTQSSIKKLIALLDLSADTFPAA